MMADLPWWMTESSQQGVRELLAQYRARGLTEEACNKMLEDHHIDHISRHLCGKWRLLPPLLGMPKVTESDIERDYPREEERRRGFLLKWKEAEGSEATYRKLIAALLEIGSRQDAEGICEFLFDAHDGPPVAMVTTTTTTTTTTDYPPKVLKSLQQQLNRNRNKIMFQYASYVSALCDLVKVRGVTVPDLTSFLLNLPTLNYRHDQYQHKKLLAGKRNMLKSAKTINEVFDIISEECASFLNYGIFQSIALKYEIELAEHKDLNYSEHLREYLNKHKVSELVKVVRQMAPLIKETDSSKMEMTFKLDIELTNRIAMVYDLEIAIADALGLDPLALELTDVNEGCVIVTFLIPTVALDAILTEDRGLADSHITLLKALPIIWVRYEGRQYDVNTTTTKVTERPVQSVSAVEASSSASMGYPPPPATSQRIDFVPIGPTDAESATDQEAMTAEPSEAPTTSVVKLVQLSTNKTSQAKLTGVNLSELDKDTVNTVFRCFARNAEVDDDLSQSDCNAFRHATIDDSSPAIVIADRLQMYEDLLGNMETNNSVERLNDEALESMIQIVPTQEGGAGGRHETDASHERFRFNFADLRRHLLDVCSEVFSRERVAQCTAKRLLLDFAIIIKYCYGFCKRLILQARSTVGNIQPSQVFRVLCEVISAILVHLVNIRWMEVVKRVGGWVALASTTGLLVAQPVFYIPITVACSVAFAGWWAVSYLTK